jgi:pyruvate/2-oxoglutarate dehydrogenase complex dihydrolipoamide acyltransferase (E2) component
VTIASEIEDLATRARNRSISLDDLKGGTCTITNMGALGGILATPIIHQPEVAILGMHAIKDRPVVRDGEIVIRKMMYLSLSFDHRIVDGAEAGRFMNHIVELISNPILLMTRL